MKSIMYLFEELVKDKCGATCIKILKLLEGKENVSEFKLSEQLDMNINELRILLYKLTEDNLISSIRKKDKQKGWYIYYWTFNFKHARDLLVKHKEKQLEELNHKLANKEIPKYVCSNGCISLSLEDAMEIEFKCPECNSLLKLKEVKYNEEIIRKKIKETEEELEKIRKAVIIEVVSKEKKEAKIKPKKIVKKKKLKKKSKKEKD
jgi:transcription initiation factor TFIIE subunit alpha